MKLSNQELDALVGTIISIEKQKVDTFNENLQKNPSKQDVEKSKKYYKALSSVPIAIRKKLNYYDNPSEKDVLTVIVSFKKKTYISHGNDLRNDIVVKSMESENLGALKKKLGLK